MRSPTWTTPDGLAVINPRPDRHMHPARLVCDEVPPSGGMHCTLGALLVPVPPAAWLPRRHDVRSNPLTEG